MPHLDTKTTKVNGFVHFRGFEYFELPFDEFKAYLEEKTVRYGFGLHDQDLSNDGDCVYPHFTFCFDLKNQTRLSTVVNDIARACDVSPLAVTVDRYSSFMGSYQYILHRNRPNKYQYGDERLFTNIPHDESQILLNSKNFVLDFDNLFELISHAKTMSEVIAVIGMGYYRHYRSLVLDMWKETHDEFNNLVPVHADIVRERVTSAKAKYLFK